MEDDMSAFCIKASTLRHGGGANGGCGGNKCGRWNPTSEQVKVLTDLFRSGLRTPSTDQIQRISTQLSFYGKIESKNVFYWFQNHKARERQKRRKVSVDDRDLIRRDDTLSSLSSLKKQRNKVLETERVIETLQLFPVDSFEGLETEKIRMHGSECKETTAIGYSCGSEMDHPPLDLRLSFI